VADLKLDYCSHEAAKFACEHWHYSRCTPKFKQVWVGVWEDKVFKGIVAFGRSSTPYLGQAFSLATTQCAELTRIALRSHEAPVSRIMAIAIRLLKKQSPGMRLLVSLADPGQGHHGGVYQAMGWAYIGRSTAMTQYYYRGKWRNDSSLMRDMQKDSSLKHSLKSRKIAGKHKYILPLDEDMRRQIELLRKPYPKRTHDPLNSGGEPKAP